MFKKIGALVVAVAPLSSFAAVPTDAMTAISGASADAITVGWAVFAVLVAIWAVKKARSGL